MTVEAGFYSKKDMKEVLGWSASGSYFVANQTTDKWSAQREGEQPAKRVRKVRETREKEREREVTFSGSTDEIDVACSLAKGANSRCSGFLQPLEALQNAHQAGDSTQVEVP